MFSQLCNSPKAVQVSSSNNGVWEGKQYDPNISKISASLWLHVDEDCLFKFIYMQFCFNWLTGHENNVTELVKQPFLVGLKNKWRFGFPCLLKVSLNW